MVFLTRREALTGIAGLAGSVIVVGSGCAINPVTRKPQIMLMSESKEIKMGADAHEDIVKSYGLYKDTTVQNWFTDRGKQMTPITHRPNLPYHFTVLDSPVINAFAVPGGYIYVTRGILAFFNNEAQFAGVLGHELGHVNARHTAARYSKAELVNIGLGIGTIFSEEFRQYSQLVSMGTTMLFLKFSRDDEREADKLGVLYSSSVGYDAVQMSEFFKTLERMQPKGGSLPAWQSTHPDPGDRIKATKRMALDFQKKHPGEQFVVRQNEYLDLVDGIVYGDDPRQGYVKEGIFYHPEMKFSFPVPTGWKLSNQPSEVRMSPEKQGSIIIFMAAQGNTPAEASTRFVSGNKVEVLDSGSLTVNGMDGVKTVGVLGEGDQRYGIVSYYFLKDGAVFAFHGLSSVDEAGMYTTVYEKVVTGFKRLTDASLINVSPARIKLIKTDGAGTLQNVFDGAGIPKEKHDELAILNGMELGDSLSAGTRVKIIS
ncbi:M48 family metalloprotease [bacterium]|nr:M48 family metalloprotease [bacterium]